MHRAAPRPCVARSVGRVAGPNGCRRQTWHSTLNPGFKYQTIEILKHNSAPSPHRVSTGSEIRDSRIFVTTLPLTPVFFNHLQMANPLQIACV